MPPRPTTTAAAPRAKSRPSWNPAVPPPPVTGAALGMRGGGVGVRTTGLVTVGVGVAVSVGVAVAVVVGVGVAVGVGVVVAGGLAVEVEVGEPDAERVTGGVE